MLYCTIYCTSALRSETGSLHKICMVEIFGVACTFLGLVIHALTEIKQSHNLDIFLKVCLHVKVNLRLIIKKYYPSTLRET